MTHILGCGLLYGPPGCVPLYILISYISYLVSPIVLPPALRATPLTSAGGEGSFAAGAALFL